MCDAAACPDACLNAETLILCGFLFSSSASAESTLVIIRSNVSHKSVLGSAAGPHVQIDL